MKHVVSCPPPNVLIEINAFELNCISMATSVATWEDQQVVTDQRLCTWIVGRSKWEGEGG